MDAGPVEIRLPARSVTEVEFTVGPTVDAVYRAGYVFRITDGGSPLYGADLAVMLAREGQCDEARHALAEAYEQVWRRPRRAERRALAAATGAINECRDGGGR